MFSNVVKIMLYVNDVAKASDFWQSIGFIELERQEVDGTLVVELALKESGEVQLVLYDLNFIQAHSPEVMGSNPSLMFASDDTMALYKKMKAQKVELGELMLLGEDYVFNFADNEGNYFAVQGK
ncbi:lactoylglutathione lyase [Enterococcus sp. PF1-24]|uniref:VOC family protein n=1 Tax=unclassified Enterococcus TaxID=2608891 RepID=UPI0024745FB4|nr:MULTISPECIES: VOC family protein [unclassified Enterococcus]MDH6365482.1 lactoylglutathione lyase [Enterococcus sp. PFB1-1]MDH6402564.1 lactoylglutathione lyase [Enterococcus sp. PF1-24]